MSSLRSSRLYLKTCPGRGIVSRGPGGHRAETSRYHPDRRRPACINGQFTARAPEGEGGSTIDLSEHGMYVPMSSPYPRNRRLKLQISIRDRTISAEGRVLYSHTPGAGFSRKPGMELEFIAIEPQDQDFIRKFIRDEIMLDVTAALNRA